MNIKCGFAVSHKLLSSSRVDIGTIKGKQKARLSIEDHTLRSVLSFEALIEFGSLFGIECPFTRPVAKSSALAPVHLGHLRQQLDLFLACGFTMTSSPAYSQASKVERRVCRSCMVAALIAKAFFDVSNLSKHDFSFPSYSLDARHSLAWR
jgi:hypothetical protein